MKDFGDKGAGTAAVLCTEHRCVKNSALHIQDKISAELEAEHHDGRGGHEVVIVYVDYSHPISHDQAVEIEAATGVPNLDELTAR